MIFLLIIIEDIDIYKSSDFIVKGNVIIYFYHQIPPKIFLQKSLANHKVLDCIRSSYLNFADLVALPLCFQGHFRTLDLHSRINKLYIEMKTYKQIKD